MARFRIPPYRIYEPNIIHNPLEWMGIWTPQGWRVHQKRWGNAERIVVSLDGDGQTTFFPEVLRDPSTGRVEWSDDLHLRDDPFTDQGIYPADPRVEYPVSQPRWAVSHTLLCYPFADHGLHTHEYVWDLEHGHLETHFRRHVALEMARTDAKDGKTVTVAHRPISTTIEGNVRYPLSNSAVRGVWSNSERSGINLYTKRVCQLISMDNGVYAKAPFSPVVQCHGLYATSSDDPLCDTFDAETGSCCDPGQLADEYKIPLDRPRLGMVRFPYREAFSQLYQTSIPTPAELYGTVSREHLTQLVGRLGVKFEQGKAGFADEQVFHGRAGAKGFVPAYDLNGNGEIDSNDAAIVEQNLGRVIRYNLYLDGYFGGDWLSTSCCLDVEHRPGVELIADYEYGGGYDSAAGVIRLLESPGPNQPVWVEYFYDAPAEPGSSNIRVHLYRERA